MVEGWAWGSTGEGEVEGVWLLEQATGDKLGDLENRDWLGGSRMGWVMP